MEKKVREESRVIFHAAEDYVLVAEDAGDGNHCQRLDAGGGELPAELFSCDLSLERLLEAEL